MTDNKIFEKIEKNEKLEKQAGAGAVPSSGLDNSLVKIDFFLLELQKRSMMNS